MSTQEVTQNTVSLETLVLNFEDNQTLEAQSLNTMVDGTNRALQALVAFRDRLSTIENTDYALSDEVNDKIRYHVNAFLADIEAGYVSKESFSQDLETFKSELDQELFREVEEGSTDEPGKFTKYKEELSELYENLVKELDQFKEELSTDLEKVLADTTAVGDIRVTTRNDLGDNWLLCNGDVVDQISYPLLASILAENFSSIGGFSHTKIFSTSIKDFKYANGYYVVTNGASLAFSTSLTGNWTTVTIDHMPFISYIAYGDGYWAVCGKSGSGTEMKTYVAYTQDLGGNWELTNFYNSTHNYKDSITIEGFVYAEGIWAIVFWENDYSTSSSYTRRSKLVYTKSLLNANWQTETIVSGGTSGSMSYVSSLAYGNDGIWLIGYKTSGDTARLAKYSLNSAGQLTESATVYSNTNSGYPMGAVAYGNNSWLASDGPRLYYSEMANLSSTSSWKKIGNIFGDHEDIIDINYTNNLWFVRNKSNRVAYSENPNNGWKFIGFGSSTANTSSSCRTKIYYIDSNYVLGKSDGSLHYASNIVGDIRLPIITQNEAYVYIKAKDSYEQETPDIDDEEAISTDDSVLPEPETTDEEV